MFCSTAKFTFNEQHNCQNKSCLKRTIPNQIIVVGNYSYYIVGTVYLRRPNFSIKAL